MDKQALDSLFVDYPDLLPCRESIVEAFEVLQKTFADGGKLLICGNGGSAADAGHIAGELLKGFGQKRPLHADWQEKLGKNLAAQLQGALPTLALPDFTALLTAYANDCNPEYGFAQLTWGLGQAADTLLCISTSGNSKNILNAAEVARAKGLKTIGLSGQTGGQLKDTVDTCICVPHREVYRIQERHLPIYHALCLELEKAFF